MLWRSSVAFSLLSPLKKNMQIPLPSGCLLKRKNIVINQHQGQPGSLTQGL